MNDSPMPELPNPQQAGEQAIEDLAAPEFLASLLADGDDDLAAWVMSQALAEKPRAEVYDDVVRPAMELVGTRWEKGEWSIAVEHLATVALSGALNRLRPAEGPESRVGPTAVLAAPEAEQHIAGLACLAQVLEEDGWHVENLGANVPAADLVGFVSGRSVDLVALSIGTPERFQSLRRTIDALRAAGGRTAGLPIIVGGHGLADVEEPLSGASRVCSSLAEAREFAGSLDVAPGTGRDR